MKTIQILRIFTIVSSSLTALAAGLALLPVASAELPMPPEWRPYLAGIGMIAVAIRAVVVPTLDAVIKSVNDTKS